MTDGPAAIELDAMANDIAGLQADRIRRSTAAAAHQATAAELRSLATAIELATDPLAIVLDPIIDLHNATTWRGRAAHRSRQRLDRHEDRCLGALRSSRGLAAELRAEADVEDARARYDDDLATDLLRQIADLERQLGLFDHV